MNCQRQERKDAGKSAGLKDETKGIGLIKSAVEKRNRDLQVLAFVILITITIHKYV